MWRGRPVVRRPVIGLNPGMSQSGEPGRKAEPPGGGPRAWFTRGAFAYPAYRQYWVATVARVFGLQFRFIGVLWLVAVELDRSPAWVGMVSVASALPTIVLSVPAGVVADRYDNRRILVVSQGLTAVLYFGLAVVIVVDVTTVGVVIAWAIATGALAALANPAQSSILPRLIDMKDVASAVAFTSSVWNSMRIIGPAAAGLLIAMVGTGQAFFVGAAGFGLSTVLLMRMPLRPVGERRAPPRGGMMAGFAYVFSNPLFLATIGLSFFTSVFGSSYQVLLPFFADDLLHSGSTGFGLMEAAAGVGALLGTLSVVKLGSASYRGPLMLLGAAAFGLLVGLFAASRLLPLSMALLFAAGFASSVYLNLGMTTLQVLVPDDMRGRVMGIWSMTWFLSSIGGFVAGWMAEVVGVPWAVALGGLSVAAFAAVLYVLSGELRSLREVTAAGTAAAPAA